jgi:hypothetical protein
LAVAGNATSPVLVSHLLLPLLDISPRQLVRRERRRESESQAFINPIRRGPEQLARSVRRRFTTPYLWLDLPYEPT